MKTKKTARADTSGFFGDLRILINSEYDVFKIVSRGGISNRDVWLQAEERQKSHPNFWELEALHHLLMARFRSWSSARWKGGSFSDAEGLACVMPHAYIARSDGRPRGWLQLEFAASNNERLVAYDEDVERGPDDEALFASLCALREAVQGEFPRIAVVLDEEEFGYFTLNLVGEVMDLRDLYEAALMAAEIVHGDAVLDAAHEWIG